MSGRSARGPLPRSPRASTILSAWRSRSRSTTPSGVSTRRSCVRCLAKATSRPRPFPSSTAASTTTATGPPTPRRPARTSGYRIRGEQLVRGLDRLFRSDRAKASVPDRACSPEARGAWVGRIEIPHPGGVRGAPDGARRTEHRDGRPPERGPEMHDTRIVRHDESRPAQETREGGEIRGAGQISNEAPRHPLRLPRRRHVLLRADEDRRQAEPGREMRRDRGEALRIPPLRGTVAGARREHGVGSAGEPDTLEQLPRGPELLWKRGQPRHRRADQEPGRAPERGVLFDTGPRARWAGPRNAPSEQRAAKPSRVPDPLRG